VDQVSVMHIHDRPLGVNTALWGVVLSR